MEILSKCCNESCIWSWFG